MAISKEDIKKLADLARIDIAEEEQQKLASEMADILEYVKVVSAINPNEAELKNEVLQGSDDTKKVCNVMREDKNPNESGAFSSKLLAEFPEAQNNYLKVKKIL